MKSLVLFLYVIDKIYYPMHIIHPIITVTYKFLRYRFVFVCISIYNAYPCVSECLITLVYRALSCMQCAKCGPMPSTLALIWNRAISYIMYVSPPGPYVIGFNHGLPCYVKNMARGTQVDKTRGRRPRFLSWLRPEGHVFNIAWQAMIKTYYSMFPLWFYRSFSTKI